MEAEDTKEQKSESAHDLGLNLQGMPLAAARQLHKHYIPAG
jgi:hypothetical protein